MADKTEANKTIAPIRPRCKRCDARLLYDRYNQVFLCYACGAEYKLGESLKWQ
jgi:uncharacterized protein (DUF983 family)